MKATPADIMDALVEYQESTPFVGFVGSDSGQAEKKWPFVTIRPALLPAPEFNPAMLPAAFAAFVNDAAYRMQSSPDFIAVPLMVSLSAVVGRRFAIHPKQRDNWLVVPNLWGCIVGNPSAKKSPSIAEGLKAVEQLEAGSKAAYQKAMADHAIDEAMKKITDKQGKAEAEKALRGGSADDARQILASMKDPDEPIRKRYKTNSATIEKLGELLSENQNGMLIIRDELSGFIAELDKQGHESDRAFYLEAWSGNSGFTYDRIGRGTVDIDAACVSIIGGTQPDKLKLLVDQAIKGGVGNDGFIQRFQLLVYPDRYPEKYIDQLPSAVAESRMIDVFTRLAGIDAAEQIKLRFSPEAQAHFVEWYDDLSIKTSDPDIHPSIESHLSKYKSMVPSLALLIHLADGNYDDVSEAATLKALEWSEYLQGHMHRVYSLTDSIDHDNAITIARRFGKQLQGSFTARDIVRAEWRGIGDDTGKVQSAIKILIEHGYVLEQIRDTNGRPTVDYLINEGVIGCHG